MLVKALNPDSCHRALVTRDQRFDGRLFVGVITTGIYCRPVCPARTPKLENCHFFSSAAAAQEAGFRPCLRCRPETAPDLGAWRGTSNTVSRGLALIGRGALDGEGASVTDLAERLGIGERQLRRLFQEHVGASPLAVAQTRRVLFAKQLLHETHLSMSMVALAAGFGSVRRFNETFRALYQRAPSELRRQGAAQPGPGDGVTLRLRYRPPYDWKGVLDYWRLRTVCGVEEVTGGVYRRVLRRGQEVGTVEIEHLASQESLRATVRIADVRALWTVVSKIRSVFDLGTDVLAIAEHLSNDPMLAPLVAARPGLRVAGAWSSFELAIRAVLGQQVSVEAARRLASKLTSICGSRLPSASAGLTHVFPTPSQLLAADLGALRMPGARKKALRAVAEATLKHPDLFQPSATVEDTVARLCQLDGIGKWTAEYIALRAIREPDAFPASDAGLLRAVRPYGISDETALRERAESWRPFRAYAAGHLWGGDASYAQAPNQKAS